MSRSGYSKHSTVQVVVVRSPTWAHSPFGIAILLLDSSVGWTTNLHMDHFKAYTHLEASRIVGEWRLCGTSRKGLISAERVIITLYGKSALILTLLRWSVQLIAVIFIWLLYVQRSYRGSSRHNISCIERRTIFFVEIWNYRFVDSSNSHQILVMQMKSWKLNWKRVLPFTFCFYYGLQYDMVDFIRLQCLLPTKFLVSLLLNYTKLLICETPEDSISKKKNSITSNL